ncbi:unnamed protein product [Prunus armeniaca]
MVAWPCKPCKARCRRHCSCQRGLPKASHEPHEDWVLKASLAPNCGGMSKATQSLLVTRHCGWARRCRRRPKMWLGTKVPKATQNWRVAMQYG